MKRYILFGLMMTLILIPMSIGAKPNKDEATFEGIINFGEYKDNYATAHFTGLTSIHPQVLLKISLDYGQFIVQFDLTGYRLQDFRGANKITYYDDQKVCFDEDNCPFLITYDNSCMIYYNGDVNITSGGLC